MEDCEGPDDIADYGDVTELRDQVSRPVKQTSTTLKSTVRRTDEDCWQSLSDVVSNLLRRFDLTETKARLVATLPFGGSAQ